MDIVDTTAALRAQVFTWRHAGHTVAFVPTLGNLHAGHMALVAAARGEADRVIASVFVNPLQFGPNEDYHRYPRTLTADAAHLAAAGAHLLFTPTVSEMYPRPLAESTRVEVPGLSDILCGAHRPGHFIGVATVVCTLFHRVAPDVAVFGEKDYQQLLIIQRMVADLGLPVRVLGVATVREPDGLALSSRNTYLPAAERARAPLLYQTLCQLRAHILAGRRDFSALEAQACAALRAADWRVDYVSVRNAVDLADVRSTIPQDARLVVLAAAWLGETRLIDNVTITLPEESRA